MPTDLIEIKKSSSESPALCCPDDEDYPYGTTLDFSDEMVDALGIGALDIGSIVEVHGLAYVKRKSEDSNEEGSHKSVTLQMTSISAGSDEHSRVTKLYGAKDDQ